jgi:hypothetical protein
MDNDHASATSATQPQVGEFDGTGSVVFLAERRPPEGASPEDSLELIDAFRKIPRASDRAEVLALARRLAAVVPQPTR